MLASVDLSWSESRGDWTLHQIYHVFPVSYPFLCALILLHAISVVMPVFLFGLDTACELLFDII